MTVVAFQGEPGAFSEEAIYQHYGPDVEALPCRAFEHIFEAIEEGKADFGAVPVENSTAGSINKAYDLLLDRDMKIHGEVLLRVRYCFMTLPNQNGTINQVRAHPQSLAQCEGYLNRNGYKAVPWYDSAGAAKDLVAKPEEGVGILASQLTSQHYGLKVLERDVEDLHHNYTRFFIVGRGDAPRTKKSKTSLVFAVPDTPGALYDSLGEFARREINLVKLESRPRRNRPWHYVFYLDFEGHWQDEKTSGAMVGLLNKAAFVKFLGSYPPAEASEAVSVNAQSELLQI